MFTVRADAVVTGSRGIPASARKRVDVRWPLETRWIRDFGGEGVWRGGVGAWDTD